MYSHSQGFFTKQFFRFVLVCGACGVGKSRLCFQACSEIISSFPQLNHDFSSVHYLFSDFSLAGGVSYYEKLKAFRPSVILGLCLASSFFLQSHAYKILEALATLGRDSDIHSFTLSNVTELIAHQLIKPIVLLWHLDEYQHMDSGLVSDLVAELGAFMTQQTQPLI